MSNSLTLIILQMLDEQRSFIAKIKDLTDEEFNWSPLPDKNSIGNLLDHLIGSERYHIHQCIFSIEISRVRENEFIKKNRSKQELLNNYEKMAARTRELLKSNLQDDQFLYPSFGERSPEKTVFWRLIHVIEHNYYHIGQINLLFGIKKNNKP